MQVAPTSDVEVPKSLVPPEQLEQLLRELEPHFVPINRPPEGHEDDPLPPADPSTGVYCPDSPTRWQANHCCSHACMHA